MPLPVFHFVKEGAGGSLRQTVRKANRGPLRVHFRNAPKQRLRELSLACGADRHGGIVPQADRAGSQLADLHQIDQIGVVRARKASLGQELLDL